MTLQTVVPESVESGEEFVVYGSTGGAHLEPNSKWKPQDPNSESDQREGHVQRRLKKHGADRSPKAS